MRALAAARTIRSASSAYIAASAMSDPMCAPTLSGTTLARSNRSSASGSAAMGIPNLLVAAPVARWGCVVASRPGLSRSPMRASGDAEREQRVQLVERLGVDEHAGSQRRLGLRIGLADAVHDDPLGGQPARIASASSTAVTTSQPAPSATSRRRSCGSGFAFTA